LITIAYGCVAKGVHRCISQLLTQVGVSHIHATAGERLTTHSLRLCPLANGPDHARVGPPIPCDALCVNNPQRWCERDRSKNTNGSINGIGTAHAIVALPKEMGKTDSITALLASVGSSRHRSGSLRGLEGSICTARLESGGNLSL
jgi:hypothetical protein